MSRPNAADLAIAGAHEAAAGSRRHGMTRRLASIALSLALAVIDGSAVAVSEGHASAAAAEPAGVIWAARDLDTHVWLARARPERLDAPLAPGSVYKVVTLAAALESGVITPRTGIACSRAAAAALEVPPCSHADLNRPLRVADALAHSCNVFAATVARRLTRPAFDRVLRDLHLPPGDPSLPLPVLGLGLQGIAVSPSALLTMMGLLAAEPARLPWSPATRMAIRSGLTQAAKIGTGAAFSATRLDVLAKTGTVVVGQRPQGLVAGVVTAPPDVARAPAAGGRGASPSSGARSGRRIAFVLVAPGVTGADAAALAAERLAALRLDTGPSADAGAASAGTVATNVGPASTGPGTVAANAGRSPTRTVRVGVPRDNGGYDVRAVPLEDYVAGVAAGEAAPGPAAAALEALAITVRTYALANRGRHQREGFDLCTLTHCQVLRASTAATTAAAAATREQVLSDGGRIAQVFLSASCGGRSARPSEVWPAADDPPYLPSRADDACAGAPPWQAELRAADLMRTLRGGGFRGDRLRGLRVAARTPSGRVRLLAVDGLAPETVSAETFRSLVGRSLGWNLLKSTAFDITPTAAGYRFAGRGAGHGVGLCVIGAAARAAHGDTATAILGHYFPGLTVMPLASVDSKVNASSIVVVMPEESRPDENRVRLLAARLRDELTRELTLGAPSTLTLRFHPTVESYTRATGRQWFTSGATTGPAEAAFIPFTVLSRRGLVDGTLRHELVHLLTAPIYRDRPLWVHEGAAVYFSTPPADRGAFGGGAPGRCPTDEELRRPGSRAALGEAYRLAAVCFARAMDAGRTWTEVGK